jgi:hypothetical protein
MRNGKCKDLKRERKSVLAALCNSEKYRDGGEKIKQAKLKKTPYLIPLYFNSWIRQGKTDTERQTGFCDIGVTVMLRWSAFKPSPRDIATLHFHRNHKLLSTPFFQTFFVCYEFCR